MNEDPVNSAARPGRCWDGTPMSFQRLAVGAGSQVVPVGTASLRRARRTGLSEGPRRGSRRQCRPTLFGQGHARVAQ